MQLVFDLVRNKAYFCCVLSITTMMFVQTANIYWVSEYMEEELKGDK
jgi:hypothetical protein